VNPASTRTPIASAVQDRITELLDDAQRAACDTDWHAAWAHLEDAHVLSQPWIRPHIKVHARMLALGIRQRDLREVTGQIGRIVVAGPGSATGRYPTGNTGRSRISAFEPMPIRPDLAALLADDPRAPHPEHGDATS
jgi:Protein of unknown function (DUF3703)